MKRDEKERSLEEIQREIEIVKNELKDLHGSETEVYARIVGYYRAVKNWNKGKKDEFELRKTFQIENSDLSSSTNNKAKTEGLENKENKEEVTLKNSDTSSSLLTSDKASSGEYSYELFAKKTCPNCPPVKDFMKDIPLEGKYIDVDTDEGLSLAASKGVFASPTVILYNAENNEVARGHNVEELELIFDKILVKAQAY